MEMIVADTRKRERLLAFSFDEMERRVAQMGWPKYRARQIWSGLYRRGATQIDEMTDLSKVDRARLSEEYVVGYPRILTRQQSEDGTEKFLLAMDDGSAIESVFIPDGRRRTLCISSQVGCTLDCTFCLTARQKFKRNLKADEIVGQILAVSHALPEGARITNVVFMGMGEPLANLPQVTEAITRMTSPHGLNLSPRRITLSTAGLVPQMIRFWQGPQPVVNLSVSLNATTDGVRNRIMPAVNRLYPLATLLAACRDAPLPSRRRITFEYVLLGGENDSLEDAERLIRLVHGIRCKINLIPFNPFPDSPFRRPSDERVLAFQRALHAEGLTATLRKSRGVDILAACGQLNSEWTAGGTASVAQDASRSDLPPKRRADPLAEVACCTIPA